MRPQCGPDNTRVKSSTRIPSSGRPDVEFDVVIQTVYLPVKRGERFSTKAAAASL